MGTLKKVSVHQKGSVLIVSLVMLLLLSLIGVAGIQTTTMQDRMAANLQDKDMAFQAGEAALREAEEGLRVKVPVSFSGSDGLYRVGASGRPNWPANTSDNGSSVITYTGTPLGASAKPKYFIEQIDTITPPGCDLSSYCEPAYYRITSVGFGGSDTSEAVLTTVYRTR
ncbi:MAG TPA: PilX N-terminal domain-containing pilus assembly protein [Marinobacter sp.]|nr:PilX N-terminal domain-containing pilus assembly protein [Marinobacter sp.]